jgi:hypothetical protein
LERVKAQLVKLKEQMMNDMADEEAQLEWRVEAEVGGVWCVFVGALHGLAWKGCGLRSSGLG